MNQLILLFLLLLTFQVQAKKDTPADFILGKGTNLAHWLSQSNQRGPEREKFIQEDDIRQIASLGFEHVRLPIDEEQMWDEKGQRHDEAFKLMTSCLDWCIKYNLRAIVDLHILRSHHFNAKEKPLWTDPKEQQKFCDLWLDLSSVLKSYPLSMVAYELMNEAVADDPDDWNKLMEKCFSGLRKKEPERLIVIGSNRWQSASTFDVLKVPDDPNIILSFHFYEPFLLTHYHASWTDLKNYSGPVHYPGVVLTQAEFGTLPDDRKHETQRFVNKTFDKKTMTEMMRLPVEKAKELKLRLYCGEYGVLSNAPEADRLRWYSDMTEIFEEQGIGSANWNYKSTQFGLVNSDGSKNEGLIKIICGNK